jgi:hypothetical protein
MNLPQLKDVDFGEACKQPKVKTSFVSAKFAPSTSPFVKTDDFGHTHNRGILNYNHHLPVPPSCGFMPKTIEHENFESGNLGKERRSPVQNKGKYEVNHAEPDEEHKSVNIHESLSPAPRSDTSFGDEARVNHTLPAKFSRRLDVVKKTIFRSFKKFYMTQFKAHYDFSKRVRRRNFDPSPIIFSHAQKYIKENFGQTPHEKLGIVLVAIIDTKEKYSHPDPLFESIRSQMHKLFKNFNLRRLEELLRHHEISFLLNKFLEQPFDYISRNKEDQAVRDRYMSQIMWLREQTMDSI